MSMAESPLLPYMDKTKKQLPVKFDIPSNVNLPFNRSDLAFYSIPQLASLIKNKKISSVELTKFFIERLKKYGDTLQCVISFTEDIAMKEATAADQGNSCRKLSRPAAGNSIWIKGFVCCKKYKNNMGCSAL